MIITTKEFKEVSKPVLSFLSKEKNLKAEFIYFDFDESMVYVENYPYQGRFKFNYTKEDGDTIENFFVKSDIFFNLCNSYESLRLNNKYEFENAETKEKFKIAILKDTFEKMKFDTDGSWQKKEITSSINYMLRKSKKFLGSVRSDGNYECVFMYKNSLCTTDKVILFNGTYKDEFYNNFTLSSEVFDMITICNEEAVHVYNKDDETYYIVDFSDLFQMICPKFDAPKVPHYMDDNFRNSYYHDDYVKVKNEEFVEILNFFAPFVKKEKAEKIYLECNEGKVYLSCVGDNIGKRLISNSEYSNNNLELKFSFSRNKMLEMIKSISDEYINIRVNKDSMRYCIEGSNDTKDVCIITTKIVED
jgi:hypothetical protein